MINPYRSSDAAAPPWSPPPLTRRKIVLGVAIGLCVTTALGLVLEAIGVPGQMDDTDRLVVVTSAINCLTTFVGACIAASIGSIRVMLPLLLVSALRILWVNRILTQIAIDQIGADMILRTYVVGHVAILTAIVLGAYVGQRLFQYRRRPRRGSAPMGQ